jgi:hypothetical protein
MITKTTDTLAELYERDETAWLDAMAELATEGRLHDLDCPHLAEYLTDMARRDRREVESRLEVLLVHQLKWVFQPEKRTPSWRGSILVQRNELARLVKGVLRNHAQEVLAEIYEVALAVASAETELPTTTFPPECPWTLEQLLSAEVLGD